jgi:methyl-accepting chemotaxis protein
MSKSDRHQHRKPIATVFVKVTVIAGLCSALVAASLAVYIKIASYSREVAEVKRNATLVTPLVARPFAGALMFGKPDQIQPAIEDFLANSDGALRTVVVYNRSGALLATAGADPVGNALHEATLLALSDGEPRLDEQTLAYVLPVRAEDSGEVVGAVATQWTLDPSIITLRRQLGEAAAVAALLFLASLGLAGVLVRRVVSQPLEQITRAMDRVAVGEYTTVIPCAERSDEVGVMAKSLGLLRASLVAGVEADRVGSLRRAAFESSSAALMVLDADMRVIFSNAALSKLLRQFSSQFRRSQDIGSGLKAFSAENAVGRSLSDLTARGAEVERILRGDAALPCTIDLRFQTCRLALRIDAVTDSEGMRTGYVAEWQDVTDVSGKATVLEAIDTALARAEFTSAGGLLSANSRFLDALGAPGDLAGLDISLRMHVGDGREPLFERLAAVGGWSGPVCLQSATGARSFEATVTAIPDDGETGRRYVFLGTDTTDHQARLAEAETRRQRMMADQQAAVDALRSALARLSDGELGATIGADFPESHRQLRDEFNSATGRLAGAIREIASLCGALRTDAAEIAGAAEDMSRRTERQAAALEQSAASLDQLTASVKSAADTAGHANRLVGLAKESAETSGRVVREAVTAMSEIRESSGRISKITGVIDEIASQTNLLALNAGVEAARAGEAGRGFAVVASEVRALAQRSSDAAREIAGLISASSAQVMRGVDLVGEAGASIEGIETSVNEIFACISEIAVSAREQSAGLGEVNEALNQLDQVTQQNAAMFEEATAAASSLTTGADALTRTIARFDVGDGLPAGWSPAPVGQLRPVAPAPRARSALPAAPRPGGPAAHRPAALTALSTEPDWEEF